MQVSAKRAVPVLLCLLVCLLAAPSFAASWRPLGPFGGTISSLTVAPSDPHRLYAGDFRSTNGGVSWTAIRRDATSNVAVDPTRPDTIYVGIETGGDPGGVQKSTDGGAHWTGLPLRAFVVTAVAVDPARPSRIYAGTITQGVWRSTNGGASWQPARVSPPLRSTSEIRVLAVPRAGGIVYAGTPAGVLKSVDAGLTWKLASQGLPAGGAFALAVAPGDPKTVYAAVENGPQRMVFKSQNGGDSWSPTSGPSFSTASGRVTALAVSPRSPREVWAGSVPDGLFRSTDGGAHWSAAGPPPQERQITAVAVAPSAPGTIYVGVAAQGADLGGVFASMDNGASWARRNQGLASLDALTVSPDEPGVLWAGLNGPGLFRSRNAGTRWARVTLPGPLLPANGIPLNDVEVAPSSPSIVYALAFSWLWRGGDGGASWTEVYGYPNGQYLQFLRIDPANPSHLWGSDGAKLFQSTDGGATWTALTSPNFGCVIFDLAFAPSSPSVLYVAGAKPADVSCKQREASLFRSVDGGASWTEADAGLPPHSATALAVDPHDPQLVYAGIGGDYYSFDAGDGVWKSTDGGASWTRAGGELAGRTMAALAASPVSGVLWAAADGGEVFHSGDGGATWTDQTDGLQTSQVHRLAPDPADPRRVYAATLSGVWVWDETDRSETNP